MTNAELASDEQLESSVKPAPGVGGAEQRAHPRFLVQGEAEIVVKNGGSLFRGRILNISETGCYIQSLAYVRLPQDTFVDILFVVNGKIIRVSAEARLSTPKVGIGFRFLNVERSMQALIKTVLASLSEAKLTAVLAEGAHSAQKKL